MAAANPHPSRRHAVRDLALVAAGAIPGVLLRWRLPDLLLANLLGCLLLGLLIGWPGSGPRLLLLGGIGFCGSLTSFSSWILQLGSLPPSSPAFLQALLAPIAGGVAALLSGRWLGQRLAQALNALRGGIG